MPSVPMILIRSQQQLKNSAALIPRRCMSSTTSRFNQSSKSTETTVDKNDNILDEQTLLTQLSPLKRILCLCPVPLGRGRVSWSGGDASAGSAASGTPQQSQHQLQALALHQRSISQSSNWPLLPPSPTTSSSSSPPQSTVTKYRYGERFAIGVAVSDPYLTHAIPVHLNYGCSGTETSSDDDRNNTVFTAEIVPTFKGDKHNLGTASPIFHTNLPYFRKEFLLKVGHMDIGAVVVALPMQLEMNPFYPMPTKMQLEEERKSEEVRGYLFGLLQNYVSVDNNNDVDDDDEKSDSDRESNRRNGVPSFGPLNIQGRINRRLSVTDVFSKATNRGNWDHLAEEIRRIQSSCGSNSYTTFSRHRGDNGHHHSSNKFLEYDEINNNCGTTSVNVSPEIHAAVALNAMLERHTSHYHNSFF